MPRVRVLPAPPLARALPRGGTPCGAGGSRALYGHALQRFQHRLNKRVSALFPIAFIDSAMPERPWKDEFTLLCEKCGYVIEGLDTGGACPECGKAIAESLPERRAGTAWEHEQSLWTFALTSLTTVWRPLHTLDEMRFAPLTPDLLATWYNRIAIYGFGIVSFFVVLWSSIRVQEREGPDQSLKHLVIFGTLVIATTIVFRALIPICTWIETRGLILFAARRDGRLTPVLARAITAHGSVGWVISGFGLALVVATTAKMETERHGTSVDALLWGLGIALAIGGFLFFEVFAWLGLRRCRFANRVRPGEPGAPERP